MASPAFKAVAYATAGIITAPIWAPLAILGIAGAQSVGYALRHPKITTGAVALSCGLLYVSSHHGAALRSDVKDAIVRTAEGSQRMRNDALERRLAAAIAENGSLAQQHARTEAQLLATQRDLAQYKADRETYLADIARRAGQAQGPGQDSGHVRGE